MRYLSLLFIALLTGCAHTSDNYETSKRLEAIGLTNMPGQPIANLLDMYGKPTSVTPLPTGETGYIWTENQNEYLDPDIYLARKQQHRKYEQDKPFYDYWSDTAGYHPDLKMITHYCKFAAMARDGVVTQANIQQSDNGIACGKFYNQWRVFQMQHPTLQTASPPL